MHLVLNREQLRDKIHGCWTGKNIGGTLGGPYELCRDILDVKGYSVSTSEPLPNDDLDLQLIWLRAMQDRGPKGVSSSVLGEYWLSFVAPNWCEYGICKSNLRAGLLPPVCGMYRNQWKHSNGAWIRSEIWACLTPGCPDLAVQYAYEDACVDHGGGEGTYAAMFVAALESAAFVVDDRDELIRIGLSKIPSDCRVAKSVNTVLEAHSDGLTWKQAREKVVSENDDLGWFQAPANVAFVIIGWLYGEGDFSKSLLTAVNCGDDTDCTAATLGSILGIIGGKSSIPPEWMDPIGDRIVTIAINTGDMFPRPPSTCTELTDQVMDLVPQVLGAFKCPLKISSEATDLSALREIDLADDAKIREIWTRSPYSVKWDFMHTEVTMDYGRDPEIQPGEPFGLTLTFWNQLPEPRHLDLKWHLPLGWKVSPGKTGHTLLKHLDVYGQEAADVCVEIIPSDEHNSESRGVLEIRAEGRSVSGLIPLQFFYR